MINGTTTIFVAVEASNAVVAEKLLRHPSVSLKLVSSLHEEIVQGFLAGKNDKDKRPSWIGFELKVSDILQM